MEQLNDIITTLTTWWTAITTRWHLQADPSPWVALTVTAAAITAATWRPLWRPTRQAATIVHELGHATAGILTGRKVDGISLHTDTSGVTTSRGKPHGLGFLLTILAGYPAPSLLGLALIWAATHNWAGAALTLLTVLMLTALWLCRNAFGFLCCTLAAATSAALWWWATPALAVNVTLAVGVFMVVAGVRCCEDLRRAHRKGDGATSDAGQAATTSLVVPSVVWIGFFFAVALASAGVGAWLLVRAWSDIN